MPHAAPHVVSASDVGNLNPNSHEHFTLSFNISLTTPRSALSNCSFSGFPQWRSTTRGSYSPLPGRPLLGRPCLLYTSSKQKYCILTAFCFIWLCSPPGAFRPPQLAQSTWFSKMPDMQAEWMEDVYENWKSGCATLLQK